MVAGTHGPEHEPGEVEGCVAGVAELQRGSEATAGEHVADARALGLHKSAGVFDAYTKPMLKFTRDGIQPGQFVERVEKMQAGMWRLRDGGVRMYVTDGAGEVTSNHDLGAFTTTVWDLAITPDDRLVTGDDAGEVRVMNLADGACERVWKYPGPAWEVAVSSDGHLVAAGGLEPAPTSKTPNDVLIWDRRDGALVARLVGHGGGVAAICWAPGDARLATASSDGQARIWDVRTATPDGAKVIRHLTVGVTGSGHGAQAQCAAFSLDGRYLFVGFDDGRGRLFKL